MLRRISRVILLCAVLLPSWEVAAAAPLAFHQLTVALDPQGERLNVTDRITLPDAGPREFVLHAGMEPQVDGVGRLTRIGAGDEAVPLERYRLEPAAPGRTITLRYGGILHHPVTAVGEGLGNGMAATPGFIGAEGVFLGAESGWYPRFDDLAQVGFDLVVTVPGQWEAVSQGTMEARTAGSVRWRDDSPQEGIWLVAGPLTLYQRDTRPAAMVFLRTPDAALAERYLAATERYLRLYSAQLGPYAYPKFALVENFWETGYGMPSFTLLGPHVIRLPFLIDSSYPHEILHNWWGNGVFVNAAEGNWSEGLTAYLADHLLKEQAGQGAEYRRDQLQAYASYVSSGRDFPLSQFRERHSGATQAIGYGKAMMFFHMLRRDLGDATFMAGLRRFYREHRFTAAGFEDLRAAFEAEGAPDLGPFFIQWLQRSGAPALALAKVGFGRQSVGLVLEQRQQEPPFRLRVPVIVGLADGRSVERVVDMTGRRLATTMRVPGKPICVAVDPRFDLFRRLAPGEQPVSLGRVLGADKLLILLPDRAPAAMREAYARLAAEWAAGEPGVEVRHDSEVGALPADRAVLLLGWENSHRGRMGAAVQPNLDTLTLGQRAWSRQGNSFVLSAGNDARALAWLATDDPDAVPPLARKVPHYGKYGYLVFSGPEAENKLKGEWPVEDSPLTRNRGAARCVIPEERPLFR